MNTEDAIKISSALALCFMKMRGSISMLMETRIRTAAQASIAQHQTAVETVEALNQEIREGNRSPLSQYLYVDTPTIGVVHDWAVLQIKLIEQMRKKQ